MKYRILMMCIAFAGTMSVFADTAVGPMNYQGRLLDNSGVPVTGTYDFSASVYNAVSGGTLKYRELHNDVAVSDGVYSFLVGTQTKDAGDSTWSIELWSCCTDLYLEIAVNGETLSPRHRLAAAPFAYQATLALTTNNALALGGKSATEYDNILADICVSSKGKWLELVEECLGVGASFPGPTLANWNTLTASSNFSGLDLTKADVSGINFSGADLTGTIFKKTTYAVQGMSGANLTDTAWSSANASDAGAYSVSASTNLQGATFKNMDMSKWNLSSVSLANISKLSAAEISSCTAGLPATWQCKSDGLPASSNSFLLGNGVDLSAGSAASSFKFGSSYLNLGKEALANSNLNGATFVGNVVNQNFNNVDLTNVDFSYATITNSVFSGASTRIIGSKFINARIDRPAIQPGVVFDAADFTDADLNYVNFQQDILTGANFTGATLRGVSFAGIRNASFNGAVLDDVAINGNHGNNNFNAARFYGYFRHGLTGGGGTNFVARSYNTQGQGPSTFVGASFNNTTLSGDFFGVNFPSSVVFSYANFTRAQLCTANFNVTGNSPHPEVIRVLWGPHAECPNGRSWLSASGTCNTGTSMTPATLLSDCGALGGPNQNQVP